MVTRVYLILAILFSFAFSSIQSDIKNTSDLLGRALYEINENELDHILKNFLKENQNVKYIILYDEIVKKKFISFYRDEKKDLVKKHFDEKSFFNQCKKIDTKINFEDKDIGKLTICFIPEQNKSISLSQEEKKWIKNNPVIKVHNEYNWAPINFNKDGRPLGYSIDYIKILADIAGLKVQFELGSWDDLLNKAYDKKIDVMAAIGKTKYRETKLNYVGVYARNITSILTKDERTDISGIESLIGKKVSVVKGFFYEDFLKEKYPKIEIKIYENTLETIKAVLYGEVDATLGKTVVLDYLLSENVIEGLKYTSDLKVNNADVENIYVAVRNDAPLLQSILKKAMKKVSLEDIDRLKLKWFKQKRKISFSKADYNWLDKKRVIKYSEVNWRPLSIIENNSMAGIMGDYLNIVAETTGIEFEFVPSSSWSEVLQKFKNKEIDLVPGIGESKDETSLGDVSKVYASYPMVIVTNDSIKFASSIDSIKDKIFSLPKYYTSYNFVKEKFPDAKIIETNNIFESLLNVSNGDADVFIGHIAPALYYMSRIGKDNLKIAGKTGEDFKHHYLINSSIPEFVSIVNKVIDTISEKDREKIYNGWVKVNVEQNTGFPLEKILYYIVPPFLIILIISAIIVYWNRKLKSLIAEKTIDIKEQKEGLEKLVNTFDRNVIYLKIDLEGIILHASESFCNVTGYTADELIGSPSNIIKHPKVPEEFFEKLWKELNQSRKWKGEIRNIDKRGNELWFYSQIEVASDKNNKDIGYKIISQDITNKKMVEDLSKNLELKVEERTLELSLQKKFVQTIMDSQEQIVITTDGKSLKSVNSTFLDFFGVRDVKEFNQDYSCICDRFKIDDTNTYLQKNMKDKNWIDYVIDNKTKHHKVIIQKDGEDVVFSVTAAVMPMYNGKKCAVFTDITELENTRKNIEVMLSNIILPVLITSKDERIILYANEYASIQYETPVEELVGSSIDSIYTNLNQRNKILSKMESYGYVENLEQKYRTKTGKEFTGLLSVKSIKYNNEDAFMGMVVDITKQKEIEKEIRLIHKQTRDSIKYASLIQHTLVPSNDVFRKYFSDYLTIWHPKDIVGGDIYLFEELRDENECILMVIDCTGHGVPGAFVTMLVKAIERQVISYIRNKGEVVSPGKILGIFNRSMKHLLKQGDNNSISNAGFDGGILYYNKKEKIIKFAGAEVPLFYEYEGKVKTIKGNRQSIGYKKSDRNFEFKEHIIEAKEGMQFYLSTDGYLDQNGGQKGFPFGKRRFVNLIKENHDLSLADQQEVFLYEMMDYQGSYEKNDDITIVGIKI